jgi:hypothetical protein
LLQIAVSETLMLIRFSFTLSISALGQRQTSAAPLAMSAKGQKQTCPIDPLWNILQIIKIQTGGHRAVLKFESVACSCRPVTRGTKRFARGIPPTQLIKTLTADRVLNKQGKPIDKGYLYRVLNNRVYVGEAMHKGTAHAGEHMAIIERDLWDQGLISTTPKQRVKRPKGRTPALLKGLIFGPTGTAMTPVHTRKGGKLYRYYVSNALIRTGSTACPIRRIAAAEIEAVVLSQIKMMVQTPEIIVATWRAARKSIAGLTERQVIRALVFLCSAANINRGGESVPSAQASTGASCLV